MLTPTKERVALLLEFMDTVNPMWPLYWGRSNDGVPVEAARETFELIKAVLHQWLEGAE